MAEPRPGWTRWYCLKERRPLRHDNTARDTVTPKGTKWQHDQCGGEVLPSMREIKA